MIRIQIESIATSDPRQREILTAVHRQYKRFAERRLFQKFLEHAEMLCQVDDYLTAVTNMTARDDGGCAQ